MNVGSHVTLRMDFCASKREAGGELPPSVRTKHEGRIVILQFFILLCLYVTTSGCGKRNAEDLLGNWSSADGAVHLIIGPSALHVVAYARPANFSIGFPGDPGWHAEGTWRREGEVINCDFQNVRNVAAGKQTWHIRYLTSRSLRIVLSSTGDSVDFIREQK